MPDGKLRVTNFEPQPRVCPDNIERLMQTLLTILADIDFEHEREAEKANNNVADPSLKAKIIARLDERHRERRQPYLEEVAALESRMR